MGVEHHQAPTTTNFEVFEMQPLEMGGKASKDMTLGEIMFNK
jgi:hypothetical protein